MCYGTKLRLPSSHAMNFAEPLHLVYSDETSNENLGHIADCFIQSLGKVFQIPIIQPCDRDPRVACHVHMVVICPSVSFQRRHGKKETYPVNAELVPYSTQEYKTSPPDSQHVTNPQAFLSSSTVAVVSAS